MNTNTTDTDNPSENRQSKKHLLDRLVRVSQILIIFPFMLIGYIAGYIFQSFYVGFYSGTKCMESIAED